MKILMTILCFFLLVNISFGFDDLADCPVGTFMITTMPPEGGNPITTCQDCPPGFVQPNTGREACIPCAIGTYQDSPGKLVCNSCPAGTTTVGTASASASACVPVDGNLPAMNRWGLIALVLMVLSATTYLLRRRGLFEK